MRDAAIKRYLFSAVERDLDGGKMIFVGGPRQVGKTTFARSLGDKLFAGNYDYLNWDNRSDRKAIIEHRFAGNSRLIIFDEIHKYRLWKNFVKGEYDKNKSVFKFIVTGSSRLDVFRRGGDSLMGRYYYYRLHPFSVAELQGSDFVPEPFSDIMNREAPKDSGKILNRLLKFSGFPEVYLKQDERELRRWHNQRLERLVREDIRDVENIRDLGSLELLAELLRDKVGSLLSLNSLTEDLQVSYKTVKSWVDVLERFYYHFRIYPYQSTKIRALKKEPKTYLWDWTEVEDPAARMENVVAGHLLKWCHYMYDVQGYKTGLWFIRDRQRHEVDFLVTLDLKPWFCVEVKSNREALAPSLRYFKEKIGIPYAYQLVVNPDVDFQRQGVRVTGMANFLSALV